MVYIKKKARNLLLRGFFLVSIFFLSGFRFWGTSHDENLDGLSDAAVGLFGYNAHADTPPDSVILGIDRDGPPATACGTGCIGDAAQCAASSGSLSDGNT